MNGTYNVTMGDRGRLVVPAEVRERHGLAEGTPLVLLETESGLELYTRDGLLAKVRAGFAGGRDLVAELMAERRAEAAREDAESGVTTP